MAVDLDNLKRLADEASEKNWWGHMVLKGLFPLIEEHRKVTTALRDVLRLEGCECDGMYGYTCGMCRARKIAREALS